jgi:hypothetical protein
MDFESVEESKFKNLMKTLDEKGRITNQEDNIANIVNPTVCSLNKPTKDGARNCALGLLIKVMKRPTRHGNEEEQRGYSPKDIETTIYENFKSRDSYLNKIAKIALHLSLFTRTGRVSYSFQEAIFNALSRSNLNRKDYLQWLVEEATEEEIFPELYQSGLDKTDIKNFERIVHLEHDAILAGLNQIVKLCCDDKVCSAEEVNTAYDQELFKSGTPFETAANSICMTRKLDHWLPPSSKIYIPDTSPMVKSGTSYNGSLLNGSNLNDSGLDKTSMIRNFDVTGQIICFDVSNLIHNLAVLEKGRRLQLPWGGELLTEEVQNDLTEKFRIEILMRRYFLEEKGLI